MAYDNLYDQEYSYGPEEEEEDEAGPVQSTEFHGGEPVPYSNLEDLYGGAYRGNPETLDVSPEYTGQVLQMPTTAGTQAPGKRPLVTLEDLYKGVNELGGPGFFPWEQAAHGNRVRKLNNMAQIYRMQQSERAATQNGMRMLQNVIKMPPGAMRKYGITVWAKFMQQSTGQEIDPDVVKMLHSANDEELAAVMDLAKTVTKSDPDFNNANLVAFANNPQFLISALAHKTARMKLQAEEKSAREGREALQKALGGGSGESSFGPGTSTPPAYEMAPQSPAGAIQGDQSAALSPAEQQRRAARKQEFEGQVDEIGKQLGADPHVIQMVKASGAIETTGYDPKAVSRAGAMGIMQFMPDTAQRFGVKDPHDDRQAIVGALKYYTILNGMFPGRPDLQFAAYNAGEGRVQKAGNQVPDIRETQDYVRKGTALLGGRPVSPGVAAAPPEFQQKLASLNQKIEGINKARQALLGLPGKENKDMAESLNKLSDDLRKDRDGLEARYKVQGSPEYNEMAQVLYQKPANMLSGPEAQRVMDAVDKRKADLDEEKERRSVKYRKDVASAGNQNQVITDTENFIGPNGEKMPQGTTREQAGLKDTEYAQEHPGEVYWKKVKQFKGDDRDQAVARVMMLKSLDKLAKNVDSLPTGFGQSFINQMKDRFGIDAKDERTAQRLLLEKIKNDKAFLNGGKNLTKNEIDRITAELPEESDPPPVFRAKLNAAIDLAYDFHDLHMQSLEAEGYTGLKPFYMTKPAHVASLAPTGGQISEPDATPTSSFLPKGKQPSTPPAKEPNPLAEAMK